MKRAASAAPSPGRILAGLILVLPFEPRRPTLPLFGLQFTFLEIAAAVAALGLLWSVRGRLGALLRRPPLPVVCLAAFAAAHFVSAAGAPTQRRDAVIYSLRMAAAAVLAVAVSACDTAHVRRALFAVVATAGAVTVLAVLEGVGVRELDPFLNLFRAGPYLLEGSRRATATTENPNLAAALLACGVVTTAGLAAPAARPALRGGLVAAPLAAGLLLTYSRGGLLAALVGTALVCAASARGQRGAPLGVLASLLGLAALSAAADGTMRQRLLGDWLPASAGALYEPLDSALVLAPGEARHVSLRVTNTGTRTWLPSAYRLECAWLNQDRFVDAGCEAGLPRPLAPGESLALTAMARAPGREGSYFLVWNVVGERGPFASQGIPPGLVPAAVGSAAALPTGTPSIASPRWRWQLWRTAWDMWRERPLLGFGPDSFRRLHEAFGGWHSTRPAPRHMAHSAYLEAAASTGILGLLTLVATLGAGFVGAGRALAAAERAESRAAALALLGLLAAIATHATVESLLGFTAQYLLFGFVIGAVAALGRGRGVNAPTAAA